MILIRLLIADLGVLAIQKESGFCISDYALFARKVKRDLRGNKWNITLQTKKIK